MAVQADVAQEDRVPAMFRRMLSDFGTVDILVNSTGLQREAPLPEMTLAHWRTVLDVNLTGMFLCSREAARGDP